MAQAGNKQGGQRAKHVPQRTCVSCRRSDAKRGLIRLVRTPEGRVEIDPTGKRNGRGAYLCHDLACWDAAIKRRALDRALRTEPLTAENQRELLLSIRKLSEPEARLPNDDASIDSPRTTSGPDA